MSVIAEPAPQLTLRAIVLSVVLVVILAAANTYLGLFAGMTIASAIPAAVVSMAVLRLLGGGGILENNIVQTGASAGSSIAAGVIFTLPALVIMGYWPDFKYWWVLAIAGLGGLLGVLFSVPLRRTMIVEEPLPFPEGKAAAEVLKTGENPGQGLKVLGIAALLGAFAKVGAASGLRLFPDTAAGATWVGKAIAYMGTNLSAALLGVGYIVGLNIGIVVLAGAMIGWNIAIPIYSSFFLQTDPALAAQVATASAEVFGDQERLRRDALRRHHRGRTHGKRHPDEVHRDRPRLVHAAAAVAVPEHRPAVGREHSDDDHHDRRRFSVRLGFRLHGRSGRIIEQSGLGNHDIHDPVCGLDPGIAAGSGFADRRGRRDHDRRGGLLCRVHRR